MTISRRIRNDAAVLVLPNFPLAVCLRTLVNEASSGHEATILYFAVRQAVDRLVRGVIRADLRRHCVAAPHHTEHLHLPDLRGSHL